MLRMKVTVQVVNDEIPWTNSMIHSVEDLDITPDDVDNLLGFLSQLKNGGEQPAPERPEIVT